MWIFIVLIVIAALFVFLLTSPSGGDLAPQGGPRWKNLVALGMIKAGSAGQDETIDNQKIEGRVLPEEDAETDHNDSFVFVGADPQGSLIMTRLGFREGGRFIETWLWMVQEGRKYVIPKAELIPPFSNRDSIAAGGLVFTSEGGGRRRIAYNGPLQTEDGAESVDCVLDLSFEPDSALYHSGVHMNALTYALSMAEMKWSREYFENLRSESQTRIEQGGRLHGTLVLEGKQRRVDLRGIRDRSWGKRNWSFIRRYIWNVLTFDDDLIVNGRAYRYAVYTTVNYGTSFRRLVSGWMGGAEGVVPISAATDIAEIGEDGVIPEDIGCRFQTPKGPVHTLKMRRKQPEHSWFVNAGRFEVCESACTFEIDGISGVGMAEFGYSKAAGYPRSFPAQSSEE